MESSASQEHSNSPQTCLKQSSILDKRKRGKLSKAALSMAQLATADDSGGTSLEFEVSSEIEMFGL